MGQGLLKSACSTGNLSAVPSTYAVGTRHSPLSSIGIQMYTDVNQTTI